MSMSLNSELIRRAGTLAHGEHWVPPLARSCGISEGYIYRVLRGERPFSYRLRLRLSTALAATAADLRDRADGLDNASLSIAGEAV